MVGLEKIGPIGVAGCGRMGAPMLAAIDRAGFETLGFDVRPRDEYGDLAPLMAPDPASFAATCRVVFTVVRDIAQTEALLFEDQAILTQPNSIEILAISSTLSPRYVKDLAARVPEGIALVDAPMSGAAVAAEEARLSFMLGGETDTLDRLQPVLDAMGAKFHRMGPFGAGMTSKVLNNFVAASATVATRRSLDWADKLGVERDRLLALMHDSSGQTWFGTNFESIEFARDGHDPDNTIAIIAKDVESALDALPAAEREGLPAAVIEAIRSLKPIT